MKIPFFHNKLYSGAFLLAGLFTLIQLPVYFVLPGFPASPNGFSLAAVLVAVANTAILAFTFISSRHMVSHLLQQQETLLKQINRQHSHTAACEQAEKYFREIKQEWDKLSYKRPIASHGELHSQPVEQMYTGGDALEKYYEDIQVHGEHFQAHTSEVEYHLRYILLLMKSFMDDVEECEMAENNKKQIFRNFYYFYSAKLEFHFESLYAEIAGLATFVHLHEEIGEVQTRIEAMASHFSIASPND